MRELQAAVEAAPGLGESESRSFSFDETGRLVSEINPETGVTTYSFGTSPDGCAASTGNLVERKDADGSVTCYGYDALQRVTGVSYAPGANVAPTPGETFVYGAATVDGVVMQN